tara:strand:- start:34 stop:279 length:246 start_codon:yes stop_codon:yes gene_type:complete
MRLVVQLGNKQSEPKVLFVGSEQDATSKFLEEKSDDVYATAIYTLGTPVRVYYGNAELAKSAKPKTKKAVKKTVKKAVSKK